MTDLVSTAWPDVPFGAIGVHTPRGNPVTLFHREGTTDLSTIGSIFRLWGTLHDEYGLAAVQPKTFLDIGGHIGTVTVAVLVDNPDCRAVVLEPLPENIDIITRNLAENGVADRATVVHGAIGKGSEQRIGYTLARVPDADAIHKYVGSPVDDDYEGASVVSATYPLGDLLDLLGDTVDLGKIDCEGCEWVALRSKDVRRVGRWVGEYHGGGGPAEIRKHLGKTHEVTVEAHEQGGTGLFTAVAR